MTLLDAGAPSRPPRTRSPKVRLCRQILPYWKPGMAPELALATRMLSDADLGPLSHGIGPDGALDPFGRADRDRLTGLRPADALIDSLEALAHRPACRREPKCLSLIAVAPPGPGVGDPIGHGAAAVRLAAGSLTRQLGDHSCYRLGRRVIAVLVGGRASAMSEGILAVIDDAQFDLDRAGFPNAGLGVVIRDIAPADVPLDVLFGARARLLAAPAGPSARA